MPTELNETILPWILGAFSLLIALTLLGGLKAWRDMKRSPYFFMRRQAEKRLQSYFSTAVVLALLAAGISLYGWQTPEDTTPRMAILTNAKPPKEEILQLFETTPAITEAAETETAVSIEIATDETGALSLTELDNTILQAGPVLPPEFDQLEPTAELRPDTQLGEIAFSTEVNNDYQPINPQRIFAEGNYTLYATFSYHAMQNGMEWAWVWRRNGEVVDGGNQIWQYGSDGPGYIYFSPEEGFQPGEYTLEVWVNGELLTQSSVIVNDAALSAGN
ncbi:MAG: hypothetical protein D6706_00775 [Chloroflexi bacterium]|nr:MAG: hypothetical protein D6706_00775 [Chloroflexota bacterium]